MVCSRTVQPQVTSLSFAFGLPRCAILSPCVSRYITLEYGSCVPMGPASRYKLNLNSGVALGIGLEAFGP